MAKRAQSRLKEIKDCSIDLPNLEKVQRFLNFIETENLSYRQGVHNDIRPENILLDTSNTVYLIDWAEVTYGNILDDLAAFAEFFDLDQAQEKKLLEHYFHKPVSSDSLKILQRHRWVNGLHRASFKFRRALDSLNEHKPKSWKQALHSDNKNLQKAAYKLQIFLEKGDDSIFYENLEKIQVSTNITIIERVLLWLKTLVKDV
jgi:aminoglycoside phosphotransferase (APT) family kinase protein